MGLTNAHDYEPLWQAHLADKRRQAKRKMIYDRGPFGLGDISSAIGAATSVIENAGQYLPTIEKVLLDPALPTVIQRVDTILSFTPSTPTVPGQPAAPLGLSQFVPYMDAYIYVLQNPALPWVIGGALLLFIGGIGYSIGKRH